MIFQRQMDIYLAKIDRQIDRVRANIHSKQGVFLKKHRYTTEDIKTSPNFLKLNSIEDAIEANIAAWEDAGSVTDEVYDAYDYFISKCQEKRNDLVSDIHNRKRTMWESIVEPIIEVCEALFTTLPAVLKRPFRFVKQLIGIPDLQFLLGSSDYDRY